MAKEEIICERAEFLEKVGIDTAKYCDLCSIGTNEPDRTCWAMVHLGSAIAHAASLPQWLETEEEHQTEMVQAAERALSKALTTDELCDKAYVASGIAKKLGEDAENCTDSVAKRIDTYIKAATAHEVAEEAHGAALVACEGDQDAFRQQAAEHSEMVDKHTMMRSLAIAKAHTVK